MTYKVGYNIYGEDIEDFDFDTSTLFSSAREKLFNVDLFIEHQEKGTIETHYKDIIDTVIFSIAFPPPEWFNDSISEVMRNNEISRLLTPIMLNICDIFSKSHTDVENDMKNSVSRFSKEDIAIVNDLKRKNRLH